MPELSLNQNLGQNLELLDRKIRSLPIKKFKVKPTNILGSYVDMSIEMVNLDETLKVFKLFILDPEVVGLTRLPEKIWQQVEIEVRSLPTKTFKIDPLHPFHQSASLFIEETYLELSDVIEFVQSLEKRLTLIESVIVESLCQSIALKLEWLSARKEMAEFKSEHLPQLFGSGKKEEERRSLEIREGAIAALLGVDPVWPFSPLLIPHIRAAIAGTTSASWWIKNEHRIIRAILLQVSKALDEALLQEFVSI